MVADMVEEDTEIDQVLDAAEADLEDQGELKPRLLLLLQLEMNKPVRLRNFLHPCFHLFAISKLDFWRNLFRKCVSSKIRSLVFVGETLSSTSFQFWAHLLKFFFLMIYLEI